MKYNRKGDSMKQFVTEDSFWELFPNAEIGVVVAHAMKPTDQIPEEDAKALARRLNEANAAADQHLTSNTISQNEVVAVWRDAVSYTHLDVYKRQAWGVPMLYPCLLTSHIALCLCNSPKKSCRLFLA